MMAMRSSWTSSGSRTNPIQVFSTPRDKDPNFTRLGSLRRFPSSTVHYEPFAHGSERRVGKVAKLISLQVRLTTSA